MSPRSSSPEAGRGVRFEAWKRGQNVSRVLRDRRVVERHQPEELLDEPLEGVTSLADLEEETSEAAVRARMGSASAPVRMRTCSARRPGRPGCRIATAPGWRPRCPVSTRRRRSPTGRRRTRCPRGRSSTTRGTCRGSGPRRQRAGHASPRRCSTASRSWASSGPEIHPSGAAIDRGLAAALPVSCSLPAYGRGERVSPETPSPSPLIPVTNMPTYLHRASGVA